MSRCCPERCHVWRPVPGDSPAISRPHASLLEDAHELGARDGFDYEVALASLAIAKMDEDDDGVAEALAKLSALGVLTPPPGS